MPISPEILAEIRELLSLLRDDLVNEDQAARLVELLRDQAELRRLYIQYMAMEEHLRENLSDYTLVGDPKQSECAAMLMDALASHQTREEEETEAEEERPDGLVFGQVVSAMDDDSDQMTIGPLATLPRHDKRPVAR